MYLYSLTSQKGVGGQGEQAEARKIRGRKGVGAQSASRGQKKLEAEKV